MKNRDKIASLIPFHLIEMNAQQQIYDNISDERLIRLAIMPDVHAGFDLPIGAVALVDGHVCPSYVGYDIGCGMCSVNTGIPVTDILPGKPDRIELFKKLLQGIPHGVGQGARQTGDFPGFVSASGDPALDIKVNRGVKAQLGSLGSGNHFLEVSADEDGSCWVTIHSGSRNPGHSVGEAYMAQAKRQRDKFLAIDSSLGRAYLEDLDYCLRFALENRRQMLAVALRLIGISGSEVHRLLTDEMINENHNHAVLQMDGTVLHRKGATPADEGQMGIIPANMRDGIVVTMGLGNKDFLSSSSHGAGRVMSRQQAKKRVRMEDFKASMKGIVARVDRSVIDEAPAVYKDINLVIAAQQGVVIDVVGQLKPLINVKG